MFYKSYYDSPLGEILLVADESYLIGLWIKGQKHCLDDLGCNIAVDDGNAVLQKVKNWLDKYFAKEPMNIKDLPLAPIGGAFRQQVWQILCEIPYGQTITYGEIAKKIAKIKGIAKMSAQAVGNAVGNNPISIIIPCHRVVGVNGNLTGYGGGLDKKVKLLEIEGVDLTKLYMPKVKGGKMRIININGPINSGKTTISKLLVQNLPKTLFVEVDDLLSDEEQDKLGLSLQEGWQERLNRLNYKVEQEKTLSRYENVIFAYPMREKMYKHWKAWEDKKTQFYNITLAPKLEICLQNRGSRELSAWERERIKQMYEEGYHNSPFADLIIDNSEQMPKDTVDEILAFLKSQE